MATSSGLLGGLAALLAGLGIGGLVAMLAARLATGQALLGWPICLRTRRPVAWPDALPVAGYLRQGGRCRHCGQRLPRWWPLTEAGMGLLALLAYIAAGAWNLRFGIYLLELAVLLTILVMDWRRHEIYTLVLLGGAATGVLAAFLLPEFTPGDTLAGALWGGGIMLVMYGVGRILGRLVYGREGLAWGDVELAAVLGLITGFPGIITPLFWGPVVGIVLFLRRGWGRYFPFAPGLCLVTMAFVLLHTSSAPLWDTLRLPLLGNILFLASQIVAGSIQWFWGRLTT